MTQSCVIHNEAAAEYYFEERCHITELLNSSRDLQASVASARVTPGTTTRWHQLEGTTERYVILSGRGRVEVGDLDAEIVQVGDVVIIPPDTPQRISNTGNADLTFLAICTPRFTPSRYQDIEPDDG